MSLECHYIGHNLKASISAFSRLRKENVMTTILLVDDENIILSSLTYFLETFGWNVIAVSDCIKASEILKSDTKLDITVTDIRMTPINGLELLGMARTSRPAMPVILITGFGSEKIFRQARELGAFECLSKPFIPEILKKTIEDALKQQSEQLK